MITAAELRAGMVLRIDRQIFRVGEVEVRAGAAKMGGTVRAKLSSVRSGRLWEQHFRPLERLEDLEFETRKVQFLYSDENNCTFLVMDSYEQVPVPAATLGLAAKLLQPGTELTADFFEGEPIGVTVPQAVEARVIGTAPASRSQQDSGGKEARLENGITIQVPLFVAPEDHVSIDAHTGRYIERIRTQHRKGT